MSSRVVRKWTQAVQIAKVGAYCEIKYVLNGTKLVRIAKKLEQ